MSRWNGWGDETIHYPLPKAACSYLEGKVGAGQPEPDASLDTALAGVPASRLPEHQLIHSDPFERLVHSRGQSLPDWIALRSGNLGAHTDGVGYPENRQQVQELIQFAHRVGASLIPYGGGTSVAGHINPENEGKPVLTVDLSRLNRLLAFDEDSLLAHFGAGIRGPELEAHLNRLGCTLGHFPQSFELSTLGGWIATRSSGQQSYHYGRIEALFAGGHLESPAGALDLPCYPASAAGPDLKQVILGSEGRYGILIDAWVRVHRLPEVDVFYGVFFRDWESGCAAVRDIAQQALPVSMLRLSNPVETETTLALSGKERLVGWAQRGLSALGYQEPRCLLVLGITGERILSSSTKQAALKLIRSRGGLFAGEMIGRLWRKSRFTTPYLRNTLWEAGYALDTLETALPWSMVQACADDVQNALQNGLEPWDERVLVFYHLSHLYSDGASLYTTYLFRRAASPDETLMRWKRLKTAASQVIVQHGGTISHQHGVGRDHAPYLPAEKGELGMAALDSLRAVFDPERMMNPGKLYQDGNLPISRLVGLED